MNRINKLKLGWLFPYSGIFRSLKRDLQQGLDSALKKSGCALCIEASSGFIQSGAHKETEEALKKLLFHEEVDLVIGVLSTKVALPIIPLLDSRRTPAILLNLGADIPTRQLSSDYLFYNSLHLWKSEWVMGKWAQKRYGGEPSINMSLYEGGYGLHDSFRTGTSVSGAETVRLNILRNLVGEPDTSPLIQYINDQRPRHAHALLSGKEGQQFLRLFREHDLASELALTVNPFMAEEGQLTGSQPGASHSDILPGGLDLYNAMTWSASLDSPANRSFLNDYADSYGEAANVFSLLAYEAGLALAAAIEECAGKTGPEEIARTLGQVTPVGPRGEIRLSTRPLRTPQPVYIRKPVNEPLTGKIMNRILEIETGIEWEDLSLAVKQAYLSGWQNPYLCV